MNNHELNEYLITLIAYPVPYPDFWKKKYKPCQLYLSLPEEQRNRLANTPNEVWAKGFQREIYGCYCNDN